MAPADASPATRPIGTFKWSHSRQESFYGCPHSYYLTYYGSRAGAGPGARRANELKRAKSRHLRVGTITHRAIRYALLETAAGRAMPTGERLAVLARIKLERDRRLSCDFLLGDGLPPPSQDWNGDRDDPVLLIEYIAGDPDADRLVDQAAGWMEDSLRRFVIEPALAPYRDGARIRGARIEAQHEAIIDGTSVGMTVKLDLVYRTDDGVVIVDWKSGRDHGDSASTLQVGGYVIWAAQRYRVSPEDISFYTVYLSTGNVVQVRLTETELYVAGQTIEMQMEAMVERHAVAMTGDDSSFRKNPERWRCRGCNFLLICEEGKAVAGHDLTYPGLIHLTPVSAG